jgi:hypothetical protein
VFEKYLRIVRCSSDHLFTTIWMPLVSFKAARLGNARYQRCPVGNHWAIVRPVNEAELDAGQIRAARAVQDSRVP